MFNKFLKEMKSDFIGTRYSAFWEKVVGESVSLITGTESEESGVTQDEARQVNANPAAPYMYIISFVPPPSPSAPYIVCGVHQIMKLLVAALLLSCDIELL